MRIIVRLSMTLVALSAAALSFQSLMRLGELCGYGTLSFLYPVVVDLGAAASCAAWLHSRSRQALGMTWSLLATSVLLNGTTHYLGSTGTAPSWLLVVAVAAVPPTVLGLCVHLTVGMGESQPQIERYTPVDEAVDETEITDFWSTASYADTPAGRAAELLEQGAGRRKLARELGISEHKARQLKASRSEAAS